MSILKTCKFSKFISRKLCGAKPHIFYRLWILKFSTFQNSLFFWNHEILLILLWNIKIFHEILKSKIYKITQIQVWKSWQHALSRGWNMNSMAKIANFKESNQGGVIWISQNLVPIKKVLRKLLLIHDVPSMCYP